MVEAPVLETFRVRLNGALMQLKVSLINAEELNKMSFKGPSYPNHSVILCQELKWCCCCRFVACPPGGDFDLGKQVLP